MYLPRDAFVPDVCEQFETDCRLLCVCGDGRRIGLAAQQLAPPASPSTTSKAASTPAGGTVLELEVEDDGGLVRGRV